MTATFVRSHTGMSIKTAGTNNAYVNISATTYVGCTLVVAILFDNAATASKPVVSSIAKPAGEINNWVFLGASRSTSTSAGAFASAELWAIQMSQPWAIGQYTITLDTTTVMKATQAQEFVGTIAEARSTVGSAYSTTTTAASATTTGTAPVVGDLVLGFIFGSNVAAAQAGDTDTTAGAWTDLTGVGSTGGLAATNNFGVLQRKVLTAATHQTLNNSAAMTAGNGAIVAILKQAPPYPKTETLVDAFATQIDPAKWSVIGTVAWNAGGYVAATELPGGYSGVMSRVFYTMEGSWVWAQVAPPTVQTTFTETGISVGNQAGSERLTIDLVYDGQTWVRMRHTQGGTSSDDWILYDPVAHAYVSVQKVGGTASWWTSPDAVTWTQRRSLATTVDLSEVLVELYCGQTAVGGTQGVGYFDNVNAVPSASVAYPLSGTAAGISASSGAIAAVHPLTGVTAGTSTTAGSIAAVHPLAGVTAGTSTTAGSIAAVHPLSGVTPVVTTTSGSIEQVTGAQAYPLSGTVTVTSSTSGAISAIHPLAGVTPATSSTSGAISAIHPLAGVTPVVSDTSGSLAAIHPLSGTAVALSATSGSIEQIVGSVAYPLTGTASASSATSGAITRLNLALAAVTVVIAATSGTIAAVHPLSGTTVSTSSSSGTLQSARPLTGTAAGISATSGNIVAVHPLTGTGSVSSTTTVGSIAGKFALAGVSGAVSATTGTIEKSPRLPKAETFIDPFTTQIDLAKWDTHGTVVWEAGYIAATELPNDYSGLSSKNLYDLMDSYAFAAMESPTVMTTVSETALMAYTADDLNGLGIAIHWDGTKRTLHMIYRENGVNDTAVINYDPVAHAYVSVQMLNGEAEWWTSPDRVAWTKRRNGATPIDLSRVKIWLVCGQFQVGGATQGTGYFDNYNVPGAGPLPISGVTSAYSTTSGDPKAKFALAGTAAVVSATTGAPAAVHPLAGVTAATSAAAGSLAVRFPLTGTAVATSTTTGTLKAVHPLAGTADAVSTTSGTINLVGGAQSYPLSGRAAAVSTTTGTIRAKLLLTGITSAITITSGTIGTGVAVATGRPKAYIGATWQKKPAKVGSTGSWVEKPMKKWNGSQWKGV